MFAPFCFILVIAHMEVQTKPLFWKVVFLSFGACALLWEGSGCGVSGKLMIADCKAYGG